MATKAKKKGGGKKAQPQNAVAEVAAPGGLMEGAADASAANARAAAIALSPFKAAMTISNFNKRFGDLPRGGISDALQVSAELVGQNDFSEAEACLSAQAHALDSMFHNLANRAIS